VAGCVDAKQGPDCCRACLGETRAACAAKGMAAAYGAITPVAPVRRRRTQGLLVAIAAAISCALLIQLGSEMVQNDRRPLLLLKQAARMNMIPLDQSQMLCEGHFLDTATGIPEGAFSTLSHPGELEGYAEPLPPEMRAAIDTEVYGSMVHSHSLDAAAQIAALEFAPACAPRSLLLCLCAGPGKISVRGLH
jgi:hypothetical protein